jgi:SNF2 family DNA or RNA helicase
MSDPGTGKTRPAIHNIAANGLRTLVLAVKSNLDPVWFNEIRKWEPKLIPVVAYAENRAEAFKNTHANVIVTNIDAATWIKAQGTRWFKNLGIKQLIIDESTHYKNRTAARSKAALWIRQQSQIERVELMSGTPNPLSVTELWHQMMLLDLGERLGPSFYAFRNTVCDPELIRLGPTKSVTKWHDKEGAEEAIFGLIQPISIRHEFEACSDIPSNTLRYIDIDLPPQLRADYDHLERTALLEHARDPIVGTNAAVLYGKMLQLCSGAVYSSESRYRVFNRARYELVADLVEQRPHPSISFFLWQHQKECLSEELDKRKIEFAVLDGTVTRKGARTQIVKDFQEGKIRHLIIHPKTGAHGLTLTAGRTAIWMSPVPSPELFQQGIHRIWRGGQRFKTETICVRAVRTLEEVVYTSMESRKVRMQNFLDLIGAA